MTETNILLETGTNELEVLEFSIAGNNFGINVAKVTELLRILPPQPMPNAHACIEGVFQQRDEVYTIIDLARYLNLAPSSDPEKDIYIITNFNQMRAAFHVHSVESIYRISWELIEKPDAIIYGGGEGVVTGIATIDGRIVSILDFEKITIDISPSSGIDVNAIHERVHERHADAPILIAEDSPLLRKLISDSLRKAGFSNFTVTTNGQEAWNYLNGLKDLPEAQLFDHVRILITDIEMPQMDGHRLCKLIKSDQVMNKLPVVIFSSLIDEAMTYKGKEVGADAQLSKPEINKLVSVINDILDRAENSDSTS